MVDNRAAATLVGPTTGGRYGRPFMTSTVPDNMPRMIDEARAALGGW
jgi:hypothetical protein